MKGVQFFFPVVSKTFIFCFQLCFNLSGRVTAKKYPTADLTDLFEISVILVCQRCECVLHFEQSKSQW